MKKTIQTTLLLIIFLCTIFTLPVFAGDFVLTVNGDKRNGGTYIFNGDLGQEATIRNMRLLFFDSRGQTALEIRLIPIITLENNTIFCQCTPDQIPENAVTAVISFVANYDGVDYAMNSNYVDLDEEVLVTLKEKELVVNQIPLNALMFSAELYGDNIVYSSISDSENLFIYNIESKKTKAIYSPGYKNDPAIYGNKIVYQLNNDENADIYMYDLETNKETAICTSSGAQKTPDIFQDKIVWVDYRNGNRDIYLYDLTTKKEFRVTTLINDKEDHYNPRIYGNKIVWSAGLHGAPTDIYVYDLETGKETLLVDRGGFKGHPDIYKNKVVWIEQPTLAAVRQIHLYDLDTNTEKTLSNSVKPESNGNPRIDGKYVVWDTSGKVSESETISNIHGYNLETDEMIKITHNILWEYSPVINNDTVVWIKGGTKDNKSYMANLDSELLSTNIVMKVGNPLMTINGTLMEIDQGRGTKPVIIQGRTLIPVRSIIECCKPHYLTAN